MSLLAIMQAIKTLEESIELDASVLCDLGISDGEIKAAHVVAPASNQNLVDVPCFLNWPDAAGEARLGTDREDAFTIQVDFYGKVDGAKGPEIALAFFDATWAAFDAERLAANRLSGTVDYLNLRAERPMVETLMWNRQAFPGFHIFLDVIKHEDVS